MPTLRAICGVASCAYLFCQRTFLAFIRTNRVISKLLATRWAEGMEVGRPSGRPRQTPDSSRQASPWLKPCPDSPMLEFGPSLSPPAQHLLGPALPLTRTPPQCLSAPGLDIGQLSFCPRLVTHVPVWPDQLCPSCQPDSSPNSISPFPITGSSGLSPCLFLEGDLSMSPSSPASSPHLA